jgi:hypothetical protein
LNCAFRRDAACVRKTAWNYEIELYQLDNASGVVARRVESARSRRIAAMMHRKNSQL